MQHLIDLIDDLQGSGSWVPASDVEMRQWRQGVESEIIGSHRKAIISLQAIETKLSVGLLCDRNLALLGSHVHSVDFAQIGGVGDVKVRAIVAFLHECYGTTGHECVERYSLSNMGRGERAIHQNIISRDERPKELKLPPLDLAMKLSQGEEFKGRSEVTGEEFFAEYTPNRPHPLRKPMLALHKISRALINPICSFHQVSQLIESGLLLRLSTPDAGVPGLGKTYAKELANAIADGSLARHLGRQTAPLAERLARAHQVECEMSLSKEEFDLPLALAGSDIKKDAHEILARLGESLSVDFRQPRVLDELRNADVEELVNLPAYGTLKAQRLSKILHSSHWARDLSASRYLVRTPRELDLLLTQLIEEVMEIGGRTSEILCRRAGYLTSQLTLQEVAETLDLTRERVRQLEKTVVASMSRLIIPADGVDLERGDFANFDNYPLLAVALEGCADLATGRREEVSRRVSRLMNWLTLWGSSSAESKQYGELNGIPIIELVPLVFSELEAPVFETDLTTSLCDLSGCSREQAIRFTRERLVKGGRVLEFKGRYFPGLLVQLASFIARPMESGGHWKDIAKIVERVTGQQVRMDRATVGWIQNNPDLYLCGHGRYRHVRFLSGNLDQLEVCLLKVHEGMSRDEIVRIHLDQALASYCALEICDRWAFRWFVRHRGADYGFALDGQSSVDDLVLDQGIGVARDGSRGTAARLLEVLSKSSRPLAREDLFERAKVKMSTGDLQCSFLLQSGEIVTLGRRRFCSVDVSTSKWEHRQVVESIERARSARCKEVTVAELRNSLTPPDGIRCPSFTWIRSIMRVYAAQNQLDMRQNALQFE